MRKSTLSVSSIGLLALIFVFFNSVSSSVLNRFSFDLTEEGLYSLSEGSVAVLESLAEPVVIRFYFSRLDSVRDAGVQLYATRVRDLLQEYARKSGGMLTLEEYDPQPDSEEEEWAQKYGLQPIPLPSGERLYFGMVAINSSGKEEALPLFNINRQETLEYDVTRSIYRVALESPPKVGVISTLPIQGTEQNLPPQMAQSGGQQPAWILANQLESIADISYLGTDIAEIPEDIKALVVLHPKQLSESTRYAIDQYVMRGGNLFLAVDPYCAADMAGIDTSNPMAIMTANRSSDLNALTSGWGVELIGKQVVGDSELATAVTARPGQPAENFLVWLSFGNDQRTRSGQQLLNSEQIVTNQISSLLFPWSGALKLNPPEGIEAVPLISTTDQAMMYEEDKLRFAAQDPAELARQYVASGQAQVVAARLRGKFKSAFSGKPGAAADAAASEVGGHIPQGVKEATIIVVADVDFLADEFSAHVQNIMGYRLVSLLNENLTFALNSVELLSGSDELIALRSRGSFLRPFLKVRDIEARAQAKWRTEEVQLQAERNAANQRLSQLQSVANQEGGQAVFSQALLDELRQLREQRRRADERLREVRYQLRKDKETLGNFLFVLNTFGVPSLLVLAALYISWRQSGRGKKRSATPSVR